MSTPRRRPKGQHRAKDTRREPRALSGAVLAAIVIVGLLTGVALAGGIYVNETLDRVKHADQTDNQTLKWTDIIEADDRTDQADTPGITTEAQKGLDIVQKTAVLSEKDISHILLIGTDRQVGAKVGRADALMLVTINQRTKQIRLTSLLRSMVVKIPGKGWSMLSHAYSWGGAELVLQTLSDNLRIKVDDFMVVDFSGFEQAINTVGGIDLSITEKEVLYIRQSYPHLTVKTGMNHVNGEFALAFSRIRQIDSELMRMSRQRRVVEALIVEAKKLSIGQVNGLTLALFPLIQTNLSKAQLLTLLLDGYKARTYPTSQLILPVEGSYRSIVLNQATMVQADLPVNMKALHQFVFGEPAEE